MSHGVTPSWYTYVHITPINLHIMTEASMLRPIVLRGLKVAVSTKGKYSNYIQGIRALQVVANPGYASSHRSISKLPKVILFPQW